MVSFNINNAENPNWFWLKFFFFTVFILVIAQYVFYFRVKQYSFTVKMETYYFTQPRNNLG